MKCPRCEKEAQSAAVSGGGSNCSESNCSESNCSESNHYRVQALSAVGWRHRVQHYMKPHARQPSFWLSPDGQRFDSTQAAWDEYCKQNMG